MATVIKDLWGIRPAFLKFPKQRNLVELIAHAPNAGVGLRVIPTVWHMKGWSDSFYTVTNIQLDGDMAHGKVFGKLTWRGREEPKITEIRKISKYNWHLYQPPSEMKALEMKLGIPADAPTA
ncbi:hypothetical protein DFJ77DRAFT_430848 [Powellomyces hirtus]|nr:hypothetical protein DFJ77DRAFT_430848 [Powellomyces hirtus]